MFQLVRSTAIAFLLVFYSSFAGAGELININKADASVIAENLTGIGQAKAMAIVEYRKANGDFTSVDDLIKVKGIGLKLLDRNRALISLTKGAPGVAPKTSTSASKPQQPAATGS
jgi:competence protein ComEA